MTDIEAFLLFLVYILPFGGIANLIIGIAENDNSKIIPGMFCILASLFIIGYLLYREKKENRLLAPNIEKAELLVGIFRHILGCCIVMAVEFIVMQNFNVPIRYIFSIICISLIIMTIIVTLLEKI